MSQFGGHLLASAAREERSVAVLSGSAGIMSSTLRWARLGERVEGRMAVPWCRQAPARARLTADGWTASNLAVALRLWGGPERASAADVDVITRSGALLELLDEARALTAFPPDAVFWVGADWVHLQVRAPGTLPFDATITLQAQPAVAAP